MLVRKLLRDASLVIYYEDGEAVAFVMVTDFLSVNGATEPRVSLGVAANQELYIHEPSVFIEKFGVDHYRKEIARLGGTEPDGSHTTGRERRAVKMAAQRAAASRKGSANSSSILLANVPQKPLKVPNGTMRPTVKLSAKPQSNSPRRKPKL